MNKRRSILLRPGLRSQFYLILWGILLLPLFGTGLILFFMAWKRHSSVFYEIFDKSIRINGKHVVTEVILSDIEDVSVLQTWTGKKLDTGNVVLKTANSEAVLEGIRGSEELASTIRHAAGVERARLEVAHKTEVRTPDRGPGVLDRMNDLTGMWQQGLITDEEFEKERKHFE